MTNQKVTLLIGAWQRPVEVLRDEDVQVSARPLVLIAKQRSLFYVTWSHQRSNADNACGRSIGV